MAAPDQLANVAMAAGFGGRLAGAALFFAALALLLLATGYAAIRKVDREERDR